MGWWAVVGAWGVMGSNMEQEVSECASLLWSVDTRFEPIIKYPQRKRENRGFLRKWGAGSMGRIRSRGDVVYSEKKRGGKKRVQGGSKGEKQDLKRCEERIRKRKEQKEVNRCERAKK
jgi:hypothetical protein